MKVESRLKDVLTEHGLDHHGVIQEIAQAVGVNRHTIAKLYSDRSSGVTFAMLGRLRNRQDAGIVISLRDHRQRSLVLAIFGFSGWATEAIGGQLVLKEDLFWPPAVTLKTREVGVFVCQLSHAPADKAGPDQGRIQTAACEVIPLGERTIRNLLGQ